MSEKNLPPSHTKLRQARERGQIGISQDLIRIVKLLVIGELAFATEAHWRNLIAELLDAALRQAARPRDLDLGAMWGATLPLLALLLVLTVGPALLAALTTLTQTRFNVAPEAFSKGFDKLNPATNLMQLFSLQKLVPSLLGPPKSLALLTVITLEIKSAFPTLAQLFRVSPQHGWSAVMHLLRDVLHSSVVVLIVIAVLDVIIQRYMVYRQLRMDISELKRDHKQNEGDPEIKHGRKRFSKEVLMSEDGAPRSSRKATAVVVNPEHLAVALYFNPASGLPTVIDKAEDADARVLRWQARRDGVPVIRYIALARHLYAGVPIGGAVPPYTFKAVALLLRVAEELQKEIDAGPENGATSASEGSASPANNDDDINELPEVNAELGQQFLSV